MENNQIYKIPHTIYLCEWSTPDDGGYHIFGSRYDGLENRFERVIEVKGFRNIKLIERVRDHWVVDTWLSCSEGETSVQVKLRSHKYLKQLLRGAELVK